MFVEPSSAIKNDHYSNDQRFGLLGIRWHAASKDRAWRYYYSPVTSITRSCRSGARFGMPRITQCFCIVSRKSKRWKGVGWEEAATGSSDGKPFDSERSILTLRGQQQEESSKSDDQETVDVVYQSSSTFVVVWIPS